MQVALRLDLPQEQINQFHSEYWRLQNQDKLEQLYMLAKGKVSVLWKIYKELMIIGGMAARRSSQRDRSWSSIIIDCPDYTKNW